MESTTQATPVSTKKRWTRRILSTLAILFLVMDGVMKLVNPAPVVEGMTRLGYPLSLTAPIGIILLLCVLFYAIPRTSILGAILLTGYLGGAVASQLRVGEPLFSHVLFPVYFGVLIWAGLYLRHPQSIR
jgi:ABC-type transport system involved in cytochrome c biogenesis permease component